VARLGLPSLDRISALPGDVIAALRMIPQIVENTRVIEAHTAALGEVAAALQRVASHTGELPALREEMTKVAAQTRVLEPMDRRMAVIEEAMPTLVEVQRHLANLPETMERLLTALDELNRSVDVLQAAVEPMGRLASRVPGQRKDQGH
jgi:DNA repair ATPase RecN